MQPKRYLLRYTLMLRNAEQRIPELVDYCRRNGVESVMIITESHSMHLRHRTIEEARLYGKMLEHCGAAFRAADIEFGLNLWQILGHHDAGFSSIAQFGWRPMIGHDGSVSERTPCPLDPSWRSHCAETLKAYCRCLPDYFFLDDDFRWHNHTPVQWGCYCPQHLDAFGRKLGRPVTRGELLGLVYGPGRPAPSARIFWHELLRENLEDLALMVGQAIHSVSPHTAVGLMSSAPQTHSAEGRLWQPLLTGLAGAGNRPLSRPCMGCYREYTARDAMEGINLALLTKALLPPRTRVTPELESSPFTRFNKSAAHIRLQMALAYFCVGPELTLDLYSFVSPSLDEEPAYAELLRRSRRFFDRVAESGEEGGDLQGVNAPFAENVSTVARSRQPNPDGVVVKRPWEACLPLLGVPVCHAEVLHGDGRATRRGNPLPRAISGDVPLAAPESVLREWLRGPLLLDATAAECFGLRGFGEEIGVGVGEPVGQRHLGCEEILDGAYGGEAGAWMPLRHMSGNLHRLTPRVGAKVISRLLWGDEVGKPVEFGPGTVLFPNSLGGRVAVLPYDGQTDTIEAVQFRSYLRQHQMHAILQWLAPEAPYVGLVGAANVAPFWKQTDDQILLGLANLSLDPMPLTVLWRNLPRPGRATLDTFDEEQGLRSDVMEFSFEGDLMKFKSQLPPWQFSLLWISTAGS